MGLKPIEVYKLTFVEFAHLEMGHYMREVKELDRFRSLQATIMTFAGMGANKLISPKDVMQIPILDNEDIILPIRTRAEALRMVDLYMQGLEWQN